MSHSNDVDFLENKLLKLQKQRKTRKAKEEIDGTKSNVKSGFKNGFDGTSTNPL